MRIACVCLLAVLFACKKNAEPTVPRLPDSDLVAGGSVQELPQSTLFHTIYRYAGHAGQALRFYGPEMEKRGAHLDGQAYIHDNMVSSGGALRESNVKPKDSAQPGVYVSVLEVSDATYIDVWENVPKGR
jgi:hypothetical protein